MSDITSVSSSNAIRAQSTPLATQVDSISATPVVQVGASCPPSAICNFSPESLELLNTATKDSAPSSSNWLSEGIDSTTDMLSAAADSVGKATHTALDTLGNGAEAVVNGLEAGGEAVIDAVTSGTETVVDTLESGASTVMDALETGTDAVIDTVSKGVKGAASYLTMAASTVRSMLGEII